MKELNKEVDEKGKQKDPREDVEERCTPQSKEDWQELFLKACEVGDIKSVHRLCSVSLRNLAEIHYDFRKGSKDWTAEIGFRLACRKGHLEIVKFLTTSQDLLESGHTFVDIHAWNDHGFRWACTRPESWPIVKFLTRSKDLMRAGHKLVNDEENKRIGLSIACSDGCLRTVQELMNSKSESEEEMSFVGIEDKNNEGFRWACERGHLEVARWLTTAPERIREGIPETNIHSENEEAFRMACRNGHLDIVKFLTTSQELLKSGHSLVDIHTKDEQGFQWACEKSHWEVIQFLIFGLNLAKTPKIQEIIEGYPQVQAYFQAREEKSEFNQAIEQGRREERSWLAGAKESRGDRL